MKYIDINRKFTETVSSYIAQGYIINTASMSGSQGEIAHIDLTDGKQIVRVLLDSFTEWEDYNQLEVFGALGKYILDIEGTDAEERYIPNVFYFDDNLYLWRIEIPGGEVGRPAKIITQSPDNIDQLEIFGQQDYIQTSKPESMSCKEIYRWADWERQNMK